MADIRWVNDPTSPLWRDIEDAVRAEIDRTSISTRFLLPVQLSDRDAKTAPSQIIKRGKIMTVDERDTMEIVDYQVRFSLTESQVKREEHLRTAKTLAVRGANLLARARDLVVFQGRDAFNDPLFKGRNSQVNYEGTPPNKGLLSTQETVKVEPGKADAGASKYGENTIGAVAKAYSRLQELGYSGPYALVLHTDMYADVNTPLKGQVFAPAVSINPYVTEKARDGDKVHFYGTSTVPEHTGLFVDLGGDLIDWDVTYPATVTFTHLDGDDQYQFLERESAGLQLKVKSPDPLPVIKLDFQH